MVEANVLFMERLRRILIYYLFLSILLLALLLLLQLILSIVQMPYWSEHSDQWDPQIWMSNKRTMLYTEDIFLIQINA